MNKAIFAIIIAIISGCSKQEVSDKSPLPKPSPTPTENANPPFSYQIEHQSNIVNNSCGDFKIKALDINNRLTGFKSQTSISIFGQGMKFYSDNLCLNEITEVNAISGQTNVPFYIKPLTFGNHILTVEDSNLGQHYSQFESITGVPIKLKRSTESYQASHVAGNPLPKIDLTLEDGYGNIIRDQNNLVIVELQNNEDLKLLGNKTSNFVNGTTSFTGLSIQKVGNYTLNIKSEGLISPAPISLEISPAVAARIRIDSVPEEFVVLQQSLSNLSLSIVDSFDNIVNQSSAVQIVPSINSNCSILKNISITPSSALFSSGTVNTKISLNQVGTTYLKIQAPGLTPTCSPAINVYPEISVSKNLIKITSGDSQFVSNLVSGGKQPYSYRITSQNSLNSLMNQETGFFEPGKNSGLNSIIESVTVTDSLNQSKTISAEIFPELKIVIPKATLVANKQEQITVTGGQPPYTYYVTSGLINTAGLLTAPSSSGIISLTVRDSSLLTKSDIVAVNSSLAINPNRINMFLSGTELFLPEGGIPPYFYSVVNNFGSIDSTGLYSAPSTAGEAIIRVSDSDQNYFDLIAFINNGPAEQISFETEPVNMTAGSPIKNSFKIKATNFDQQLDNTFSNPISLKLFDSSCLNEVLTTSLASFPEKFNNGYFSPSFFSVSKMGTFTIKATSGDFSACSQPFLVSGNFGQLEANGNNNCVLKNGRISCWGYNGFGLALASIAKEFSSSPTEETGLTDISSFSLGESHLCINNSNALYCVGSNSNGQIQDNPSLTPGVNSFTAIGESGISLISLGKKHSCVGKSNNISCFGDDSFNQLGRGTPENTISCGNISDSNACSFLGCLSLDPCSQYSQELGCVLNGCFYSQAQGCYSPQTSNSCYGISPYSCGAIVNENDCLKTNFCNWSIDRCIDSQSNYSQSGHIPQDIKFSNLSLISDFSSSKDTNCFIFENNIYCWGKNNFYQSGSKQIKISSPQVVPGTSNFSSVSAGDSHVCGTKNNEVYCWGSNNLGQLGLGIIVPEKTEIPTKLNLTQVLKIKASSDFTCSLNTSGEVFCWGMNNEGQLGRGFISGYETSPQKVVALPFIKDIALGNSHVCVKTDQEEIFCWGSNIYGESGQVVDGNSVLIPTKVQGI